MATSPPASTPTANGVPAPAPVPTLSVAVAATGLRLDDEHGRAVCALDVEVWWTEEVALLDLDGGRAGRALLACVLGTPPSGGSLLIATGATVRRGPGGAAARRAVIRRGAQRATIGWTDSAHRAATADRVIAIRDTAVIGDMREPSLPALLRLVDCTCNDPV